MLRIEVEERFAANSSLNTTPEEKNVSSTLAQGVSEVFQLKYQIYLIHKDSVKDEIIFNSIIL